MKCDLSDLIEYREGEYIVKMGLVDLMAKMSKINDRRFIKTNHEIRWMENCGVVSRFVRIDETNIVASIDLQYPVTHSDSMS